MASYRRGDRVLLKIPHGMWGTPLIETTAPGLVSTCVELLKAEGFENVIIRRKVLVRDDVRVAELAQLDKKDTEAGLLVLEFLLNMGFEIDRQDVGFHQDGDSIMATVYFLKWPGA